MATLDVGDNLGTAVCTAEFVAGDTEDTEEGGDTGDSGGLEGAGNRIPTTDPVRKTKHQLILPQSNFFLLFLVVDAVPAASILKGHNVISYFTTRSQEKSGYCIKAYKWLNFYMEHPNKIHEVPTLKPTDLMESASIKYLVSLLHFTLHLLEKGKWRQKKKPKQQNHI